MSAFIIDKRDINKHPDLREELKLVAEKEEEGDSAFIYRTAPQKSSVVIRLLSAYRVEFLIKNY